jgi:cyclic pyranopterin phosphate synthase
VNQQRAMLLDRLLRPLRTLRVSVTDRCNLRCQYCMPEREYTWLPRTELLSFEEIGALARVFADFGVQRIRLTGGEPLHRPHLSALVRLLAEDARITDLAMTTNGTLLAGEAAELRKAGLRRVTVSLDTLRPNRFATLTGRDAHARVLEGIDAARWARLPLKLDTVVLRGFNDDELGDLLAFGRERGTEVRFIEYMDVGGATAWSPSTVVARAEIIAAIVGQHGAIEPLGDRGADTAERFRLRDGTVFGIIASTTAPFCAMCERSRLTADGLWYQCLYARTGLDLRAPLRRGQSSDDIGALVARAWQARSDRGAEDRLLADGRGRLLPAETLRRDPHLEMHTRGG